jgi:peptidoglycan/LPS O-acetylase OafA/YrhL
VTIARQWPALDGLRGVAILLVIPHNVDRFGAVSAWTRPAAMVAHMGWIGVQLFFVLSGFLITRNLLDSRGSTHYYSSFFARRALRILPLYVVTMLFLLVLLPRLTTLDPAITATYGHQIWYWLFLNNWVQTSGRGVYWLPHFWSLAVEEQFYLVWPFVVAWVAPRRFVPVCAAIALAAILARGVMFADGAPALSIYEFTICRMDALAIGAIAAMVLDASWWAAWSQRRGTILLAAAAGVLAVTALATRGLDAADPAMSVVGFTPLAASFALLVLVATVPGAGTFAAATRRVLSGGPIRSVGRYSYAMYVLHQPIALAADRPLLAWLEPTGSLRPILFAAIIVAASYGAAYISYHVLEKHALALKRWFPP